MRARKPMKDRKSPLERRERRRDNRGYTLQTVIVMSILIAAAVGASVVLYRAVSSNTDARSVTDLAGSNAPSRPHGFSVERTVASVGTPTRSVPSATIRWSPPLYTGQPELEGTPASLLYKVDYGCAAPSTEISELADITLENIPDDPANDPMDTTPANNIDETRLDPDGPQTNYGERTELSIPARILEVLFPSAMPPDTVYCILQAQAYTCSDAQTEDCANPGDNASITDDPLTGQEIYSLESDPMRFELNRAPSELQTPAATVQYRSATENRVDLSWETPEYTGAGAAYLYEIQWQQRETDEDATDFEASGFTPQGEQCTVGNTHSLALTLNADTSDADLELIADIRITPYAVTPATAADAAVPPAFTCPTTSPTTSEIAGTSTLLTGIELLATQPASVPSPTLTLNRLAAANIPTATDAAKRTALNNLYVNIQATAVVNVPMTRSYNLESFELRWSRADGGGTPNTRVISAPATITNPLDAAQDRYSAPVTLNLENDKAYEFNLTANFDNDETRQISSCSVISHSQRTPLPDLEVIPISEGLRIRISSHNQVSFCNTPVTTLSGNLAPPTTQHYKVRVYDPAATCTGDYPDEQCPNEYNQCVTATTGTTSPSAEEVVAAGLTAGTSYEVEVIAGHGCDSSAKTIGFTIPSPNPNDYGYPSAPVVQSAVPLAASTAPAAPTGVSATFTAADPSGVNYDHWNLSWEVVPGSIGYFFTLDHDSADNADATRYAYIPSNRATDFSAPAPINQFTCSRSSGGTMLSCVVDDDGNTSTDFTVTVQAVGSSGVSTATSVTAAHPSP